MFIHLFRYICVLFLFFVFIVVYFHEQHAVQEWADRMAVGSTNNVINLSKEISGRDGNHIPVAACHDEATARVAKAAGFTDVFYARKKDTEGLTKTVLQAVEFAKKLSTDKMIKK